MPVETINYLLALGTLAMQIGGVTLLVAYFLRSRYQIFADISESVTQWGLLAAFILSAIGSVLTLFYSEILGFPPCPLCWWQRIFLYPQAVLFGLALLKRDARTRGDERGDRTIADYSIALSIFGLGVALYHHALQVLPSGSLPCPAEGAVSCAQRFVFEFGYITFPLMAATLFAFFIVLMLFTRQR